MEMNNKGISNQSMEVDPQGQPIKVMNTNFYFLAGIIASAQVNLAKKIKLIHVYQYTFSF